MHQRRSSSNFILFSNSCYLVILFIYSRCSTGFLVMLSSPNGGQEIA